MLGKTLNHRYIPGLDGIRALAVLAVIAYHFNFRWASGGFLGVDIFFVLSGYLITSTILPLPGEQVTINLRKFWIGRFRRLVPAAYVMIMTSFVWVMLFHKELLNTLRGDALSSIFYSSNWWFIYHKLSYFDSFGSPSPLKNLWSLAIEEQFYVVWPLVLIIGLSIFRKQSKFSNLIFIGALCSAMLMAMLYQPGSDPSRIYYGTDTRSFELLIGCWLAFVWPMKRLSTNKLSTKHVYELNSIAVITFLIFIGSILFVDEYQAFLYRGGMFLFCINAALLIACVCHPASYVGKLLSWKPLCWIGSRSYGIYLWHYPIIVLGTPVYEIGNPAYGRVALQLILIVLLAEISYRLIEMPIRKQGLRAYFKQYLVINPNKWRNFSIARKIANAMLALFLLVFFTGITGIVGEAQQTSKENYPTDIKITGAQQDTVKNAQHQNHNDKEVEISKEQKDETVKGEPQDTPLKEPYKELLAIGDSVMIDIATRLHTLYPNITIDGKIGRQVSQAVDLIPSYTRFNQEDKAVIIQLGTNGYFTNEQIDKLLGAFSQADIYLVNTRVPRPWEAKVNTALASKAQEYANITLIDWHTAALNHPEYFAPDGVHLEPQGIEALTNVIQQAIEAQS
ncbi:acyltransferase family protein [Lysinibacillus sp. NPDC097195]|uniref:acyltransferase family protein n=1 Tax=Lysinibacillus sp. NPDC097195 TaxID=3364141 RepID=UPI00382E8B27